MLRERSRGWAYLGVLPSLGYRLLGCLFGLLSVLARSDLSKDAELLVLRHKNSGAAPPPQQPATMLYQGIEGQDAEQRCRPLAYQSQAPRTPLRPDLAKPAATQS